MSYRIQFNQLSAVEAAEITSANAKLTDEEKHSKEILREITESILYSANLGYNYINFPSHSVTRELYPEVVEILTKLGYTVTYVTKPERANQVQLDRGAIYQYTICW